jgi:hypothetical protein
MTFFPSRKARNQCIIEKLSPILAGIIAEVDTNSNLDLLIQTEPNSWKHQVWLEIINDPSATGIEYSMIVSPKKQQELPEVMVKGTRCDGGKFRARMPFSWLIYRLIDRIIRTSQDVDRHGKYRHRPNHEDMTKYMDKYGNLPLHNLLKQVFRTFFCKRGRYYNHLKFCTWLYLWTVTNQHLVLLYFNLNY